MLCGPISKRSGYLITTLQEWLPSRGFWCTFCKVTFGKYDLWKFQQCFFQDVSLYFKLVLDDLPCHLLDSRSRYLQAISADQYCLVECSASLCYMSISSWVFLIFIQLPFVFGLLFCVAAALFYLAELVEEYTVITAKVIKGTLLVSVLKVSV